MIYRMNCTPAQFDQYRVIIAWMAADAEYKEFGREFVADEKFKSLTASRLAWNAFRNASDLFATHIEKEPLSAIRRDRDVFAMLQDKSSLVEPSVKSGLLF